MNYSNATNGMWKEIGYIGINNTGSNRRILAFVLSLFIRTTLFLCLLLVYLIPIRKYAGGIHAKSKRVCLVISEAVLVMAELAYKFIFIRKLAMQ